VGTSPRRHASIIGEFDKPVTSFGAAILSNHVYTLGGYSGTPHEYVREDQSDAFARYDLSTGRWESLASPGKSQSATLTSFDGRLIRVGGMRIKNGKGEIPHLTSLDTVEIFDPSTGAWTKSTPLPEPRSSHATVLVDHTLYVIGGWDLQGAMNGASWADSMFVADLSRPQITWNRVAMPFKSRALGAARLGRFIVGVGGMEGRRVQRRVHVYDTVANTWAKAPDLPEPGFGVAVVSDQDRVYAAAASGKVYVLDSALARWDVHGEMIFPRFFHGAVATDDHRLLFLGGIASTEFGDRPRHIEVFSDAATLSTSWMVPNPTGAKNRQGLFLVGHQLITFGGNKALGQHDFAQDNFLQTTHHLDLGSLTWQTRTAYPRVGQSMQTLVTSGGLGVALGGFGPQGASDKQSASDKQAGTALGARADVVHYDFGKDAWTPAAALPEARTQFGLVEHGDKLWIFGGMGFDDTKTGDAMFSYPTSVLERDADAPSAFTDSGLRIPRPRRAFAGVTWRDKYYMFGGMAERFAPVTECDVFDFASTQWSAVACPSRVRIGAEIVALRDKLYLIAGRSTATPDGQLQDDPRVEVYDPRTDQWSVLLEQLPIEDTHQLRAFAFSDRILLYTAQRNDEQAQVVLLDPSAAP
jgi:hypothetical protein